MAGSITSTLTATGDKLQAAPLRALLQLASVWAYSTVPYYAFFAPPSAPESPAHRPSSPGGHVGARSRNERLPAAAEQATEPQLNRTALVTSGTNK